MASIGKADDWPWKTEAAEAFATDEHGISRKEDKAEELATESKHIFQSRMRKRRLHSSLGAKSKGSNGVVAVGLPHRNYSVFKQADPNKR